MFLNNKRKREFNNNQINKRNFEPKTSKYLNFIKPKKVPFYSLIKNKNKNKKKSVLCKFMKIGGSLKCINFHEKSDRIIDIKIINVKNKLLIFVLTGENFLIYEIEEGAFRLIKEFKCLIFNFVNEDKPRSFYVFQQQVNEQKQINISIFTNREVKLFGFDEKSMDLSLIKTEIFNYNKFNHYFCFIKRKGKIIIYHAEYAIILNNELSSKRKLIDLHNDYSNLIDECKVINDNIFCVIFRESISIYDSSTEHLIGEINDLYPRIVRAIGKDKNNLLILSKGSIYIYDLENVSFICALNTNSLENIKKIEEMENSDIAILFGNYELAIYDIKKNIIKYCIKECRINKLERYPMCTIFEQIQPNILMFNTTIFKLNVINSIKGEVICKISDGHKKIKICKKLEVFFGSEEIERTINYYLLVLDDKYLILSIKN